jgi:hypothetical protein
MGNRGLYGFLELKEMFSESIQIRINSPSPNLKLKMPCLRCLIQKLYFCSRN